MKKIWKKFYTFLLVFGIYTKKCHVYDDLVVRNHLSKLIKFKGGCTQVALVHWSFIMHSLKVLKEQDHSSSQAPNCRLFTIVEARVGALGAPGGLAELPWPELYHFTFVRTNNWWGLWSYPKCSFQPCSTKSHFIWIQYEIGFPCGGRNSSLGHISPGVGAPRLNNLIRPNCPETLPFLPFLPILPFLGLLDWTWSDVFHPSPVIFYKPSTAYLHIYRASSSFI